MLDGVENKKAAQPRPARARPIDRALQDFCAKKPIPEKEYRTQIGLNPVGHALLAEAVATQLKLSWNHWTYAIRTAYGDVAKVD